MTKLIEAPASGERLCSLEIIQIPKKQQQAKTTDHP